MNKENPNGYIIDFEIPQGPTGATGPTGPTGTNGAGLESFGGITNNTAMDIEITDPSTVYPIRLNNIMIGYNINYDVDGHSTMTISQTGFYEISYSCVYSTVVDANSSKICNFGVLVNGYRAQKTIVSDTLNNYDSRDLSISSNVNNSFIDRLVAGDTVGLAVWSSSLGTISFPDNASAYLMVKKLKTTT